jgi:hypothetical protein
MTQPFAFAAAISFALKPSSSVALSNKTAPFYERLVTYYQMKYLNWLALH